MVLYSSAADHLSSKSASSASSTSTKTCSFSKTSRAYWRGFSVTAKAPPPCLHVVHEMELLCPPQLLAQVGLLRGQTQLATAVGCSADHRLLIELEQSGRHMALDPSSAACSCGLHSPAFCLPVNNRSGFSRLACCLSRWFLRLLPRGWAIWSKIG